MEIKTKTKKIKKWIMFFPSLSTATQQMGLKQYFDWIFGLIKRKNAENEKSRY